MEDAAADLDKTSDNLVDRCNDYLQLLCDEHAREKFTQEMDALKNYIVRLIRH